MGVFGHSSSKIWRLRVGRLVIVCRPCYGTAGEAVTKAEPRHLFTLWSVIFSSKNTKTTHNHATKTSYNINNYSFKIISNKKIQHRLKLLPGIN